MIQKERINKLNKLDDRNGPVLYWMSRDQRVKDNWALLFAQEKAKALKQPLLVCFCLASKFLLSAMRQYDFMLQGLQDVEKDLAKKNISFHMLLGDPGKEVAKFANDIKAGTVVTDFDPIKIKRRWKEDFKKNIKVSFYEVDAHNIVPIWEASDKKEFAARTIRPKIKRHLPKYFTDFPLLAKQLKKYLPIKNNWKKIYETLSIDENVKPVDWIKPGEKEAGKALNRFVANKLVGYNKYRNDPNMDYQSNLSPYLHFGQISSQRIALEVSKINGIKQSKDSFLEELIVRKELSDNFCYYEKNYDKISGFHEWAQKTLKKHAKDKREYNYSLKKLEAGDTHDEIWNAAQLEMMKTGKMHSYMRMYWAKKILEWTSSFTVALKYAIYLNDKYELDGRDPNGYTGVAWSIGGVHDRAWSERKVFGKIRYMNAQGLERKFDTKKYIEKIKKI